MSTESPASESPLGVSILFVVKNEEKNLARILPLIASQDYTGQVELIAVDSGSTDNTVALLKEHGALLREIPPQDFHHGRTRNLAASLASNEILVCLSGDAFPADAGWLRHLVAPFTDDRVGGVYGKQVAPEGTGTRRRQSLASEYSDVRQVRDPARIEGYHPGYFRFSNANAAIRRSCWEQFRWDETVLLAEDQGMCRDLLYSGRVVIYEPDAPVIHGHERSLWGEFKFALDSGASLSRLNILNNPDVGGEFRYGISRMVTDLAYFARRGRIDIVGISLISFVMRYLGVQLGKREARLPHWFMRYVSEVYGKMGH